MLCELGREAELLTVIEGDGAPLAGDAVAALAPESIEVELERGGQPAWWWLVSAEIRQDIPSAPPRSSDLNRATPTPSLAAPPPTDTRRAG